MHKLGIIMHGLDLTFDIKTNADDDNHGKYLSVFYAKKGQGVHFVSCERITSLSEI